MVAQTDFSTCDVLPEDPIYRIPADNEIRESVLPLSEIYSLPKVFGNWNEFWKITAGEGQRFCVVDTGVDTKHKDIEGKLLGAKDFTNSRYGPEDTNGHGSWCFGVIGANANDFGIRGLCHACEGGFSAKGLADSGAGSEQSLYNSLLWGWRDCKCKFFSCSWGGPGMSARMRELLQAMVADGCFIFVASGNDSGKINHPAIWPECLSVGAYDKNGNLTRFTSATPPERLDVVGPGVELVSIAPGNRYAAQTGTSMATPILCAVGMCMKSKHEKSGGVSDLNNWEDMRAHFVRTSDVFGAWRRVNPEKLFGEHGPVVTPPPNTVPGELVKVYEDAAMEFFYRRKLTV